MDVIAPAPGLACVPMGADDGHVRLWKADTGGLVCEYGGLMHQVFSLAVSWDGRRALVGGIGKRDDSGALLLGLTSGRILMRYDVPSEVTQSIMFLPEGLQVMTAGGMMADDCCIRVWEMRNGRELARLELHEDDINAVALSPVTNRLISVDSGGTVGVWRLPNRK